jgi:hypothetical protein
MDAIGGLPAGVPSATVLLAATAGTVGRVDLRVDAQVTWLPPKPIGLTVAASDTVAVVSVREAAPPAQVAREHLLPPRRVVVRAGRTFDRLRAAADYLPTALPGVVSCPDDLGTSYLVAFASTTAAAPSISFTADNCGYVTVHTAGHTVDQGGDGRTWSVAESTSPPAWSTCQLTSTRPRLSPGRGQALAPWP